MDGGLLASEEEPTDTSRAGAEELVSSHPARRNYNGHRILVLNRNWQAVSIVDARHAFFLLFRERANVINPYRGEYAQMDIDQWIDYSLRHPPGTQDTAIHTIRLPLRVPDVLILSDYDRLPMKEVHLSRENLFERDGCTCQYCGKTFPENELTIDHVIPRERGGRNTWENLVTACKKCNSLKANKLPHEAGMRLQRKPARPPRLPFAATVQGIASVPDFWKAFIPALGSK